VTHASHQATRSLEAEVLHGFAIGAIAGAVLVFVLWGAVALLGGLDGVDAGAIGLFTAAWGGPGFGGMLGAVLGYTRYEEAERAQRSDP